MDGTPRKTSRQEASLSADVLVVGAGTAGLPAAVFAARRGARVILLEASDGASGTLRRAAGHVSAAGTRLQKERGIEDTPQAHAADIARMTGGTADPEMVALACDLAPRIVAWLDELGLDWDPDCPAILHALEAYSTPRTYWGRNRARSIAEVLVPELDREIDAGRITFLPGHRLTALHSVAGTVSGATALTPEGGECTIAAAQTVMTTGGYCANPQLFQQLTGVPLMGGAEPQARGDGLQAARAIGAAIRPARHFLPHVGGIEDPPGSHRTARIDNPALMPGRAPWEIYVDATGARCLREDEADRVTQQRAMTRVRDMTFWIVWDSVIAKAAPALLPTWSADRLDQAFRAHPSFTRAGTLDALAMAAGITPAGLLASVADYNARRAAGTPDPMGRTHRPAAIATAPFFALKVHGTTATASAGLAVDRDCRVLDTQGTPIPGLTAAGEILGRELLSGNAFVGGMSITPALSFGRRLGETTLVW